MASDDIVFTAYNEDRDITITLLEGEPNTFGRSHIVHQRPKMASRIGAIKHTVENIDKAYWDKKHDDRERIVCFGADSTRPTMYMIAVVEYKDSRSGTIITAWPQKNIASMEGVVTYVKPPK